MRAGSTKLPPPTDAEPQQSSAQRDLPENGSIPPAAALEKAVQISDIPANEPGDRQKCAAAANAENILSYSGDGRRTSVTLSQPRSSLSVLEYASYLVKSCSTTPDTVNASSRHRAWSWSSGAQDGSAGASAAGRGARSKDLHRSSRSSAGTAVASR